VSDPNTPIDVGLAATGDSSYGVPYQVVTIGTRFYATFTFSHYHSLVLFDVSDPAGPVSLAVTTPPSATALAVSQSYVFAAIAGLGPSGAVAILDASSADQLGYLSMVSGLSSILVRDSYLYAEAVDGLHVIDVSDPRNPRTDPSLGPGGKVFPQMAGTAIGESATATDGRRLRTESPATQAMFRAVWGTGAEEAWASQHNFDLQHVERLQSECRIQPVLGFGAAWRQHPDLRELLWCATELEHTVVVDERDEPDQAPPSRLYWTNLRCFRVLRDGVAQEVAKPGAPSCTGSTDRVSTGVFEAFQHGWMLYVSGPNEGLFVGSDWSDEVLRPAR
jgi:hypothetical protein